MYGKSATTTEGCEIIQNLEVFLAKNNASDTLASSQLKPADANDTQSNNKPSPQLIKGPTDKQIETRTADGRRRITPKFLITPTDGEEVSPPKRYVITAYYPSVKLVFNVCFQGIFSLS